MTGDDDHLAEDDELDAAQLAAMDSLWRAVRAGVPEPEEAEIETLIRLGKTSAARRRITQARRRLPATGPATTDTAH